MEMIQTEKLVYEYEKRDEEGNVIGTSRAIDEVDIEAKEGQFIAILGHNGSGKSTLAKHLNAILMPTEGSVWVDGKNTSNPDELWNVGERLEYKRTGASVGCQTVGGNGISESGQSDHWHCSRRRCGVWSGEPGRSDG